MSEQTAAGDPPLRRGSLMKASQRYGPGSVFRCTIPSYRGISSRALTHSVTSSKHSAMTIRCGATRRTARRLCGVGRFHRRT